MIRSSSLSTLIDDALKVTGNHAWTILIFAGGIAPKAIFFYSSGIALAFFFLELEVEPLLVV